MNSQNSDMNNNSLDYKEMLQRMKKSLANLEEIRSRCVDLQVGLAESHFAAAKLFHPEIVEMMLSTDNLLASKNIQKESPSASKGGEVETPEMIHAKYMKSCEEMDKIQEQNEKEDEKMMTD